MTRLLCNPYRLLRYVTAELDPMERMRTASHLIDCAQCRTEVEALAATIRFVRDQSATDDLPAGFADVEAASPAGPPAPAPRLSWSAAVAAVAAVALAFLILPARIISPPLPSAGAEGAATVVFPAPVRGGTVAPVLEGEGPVNVRVLLPYGAPAGDYSARIESAGGEQALEQPVRTAASMEGEVLLELATLPGPGRYHLILFAGSETDGTHYRYAFGVAGPATPETSD